MQGYKTSYILYKSEMLFLIDCIPRNQLSFPAKYALNECLTGSTDTHAAVEGLVYKKLASRTAGKISIEPVVELLVRSVLSASKLLIVKCAGMTKSVFILRTKNMFLHVQDYPLIAGAWKITPFQTLAELKDELNGISPIEVNVVDNNEQCYTMKPVDGFLWLEDE